MRIQHGWKPGADASWRKRARRVASLATACAVTAGLLSGLSAAPAGADEDPVCQEISYEASVIGRPYQVRGRLCVPHQESGVLVVLMAGTTYTRDYWDVPIDPATHNFRLAMNQAGHATLAIDRLGSGASSIPPSAAVTAPVQADALHRLIQLIRQGQVGGHRFSKIVLGGHSLGSTEAMMEAAEYRDVDGLLLTGISHDIDVANTALTFTPGVGVVPANLDPLFRDRDYDPGYVTTLPVGRQMFYGPADVPLPVQSWDEQNRDATSLVEVATALQAVAPVPPIPVIAPAVPLPTTAPITADVLLINGAMDKIVCNSITQNCAESASLLRTERPFYPNARTFGAVVVPGSGHDLTVSVHAPVATEAVLRWIDDVVRR